MYVGLIHVKEENARISTVDALISHLFVSRGSQLKQYDPVSRAE